MQTMPYIPSDASVIQIMSQIEVMMKGIWAVYRKVTYIAKVMRANERIKDQKSI